MPLPNTPIRHIAGGRELRKYAGYWFIQLTDSEYQEYPGNSWTGWVLFHKWKWWKHYGDWFPRSVATYRYLDGDQDNIRITNIGVLAVGSGQWL